MKNSHVCAPVKAPLRPAILVAIAALLGAEAAGAATNLYVAPSGLGAQDCLSVSTACTLTAARSRVRTMNVGMSEDIVVNLAPGTYTLGSSFQLTAQDSGRNGYSVIYQGPTNASTPAVLSGGVQVGGWIWHDYFKNIWRADMTTGVGFRQVYVNGVRAVRARYPNLSNAESGEGYLRALSTVASPTALNFVVKSADVPSFRKVSGVEAVWIHHWKHLRARLASTTAGTSGTTLNFQSTETSPSVVGVYTQFPQDNVPYYFENDFKLLDQAGEWYFDPSPVAPPTTTPQLYYIPRSGEVANSAPVIVPQVETLVDISGTAADPVHHVQLKNMTFMYSNWNGPNSMGYGVYQGATYTHGNGDQPVPGAVNIKNADAVVVENNVFTHTGAHAVLLQGQVSNYRVVHNQFSDLAAGAIYDIARPSTNGLISGNLIEKIGRDYADGIGIAALYPKNLTISNNEVRSGGYSGISIGWWWAATDDSYRDNQVTGNRIHGVMQVLDDGGGIYSLGRMMNTVFQGNHVYDVQQTPMFGGYPSVGIYLDESSRGKTVQGNAVTHVAQSFKLNNLQGDTSDNLIAGNYYDNTDIGVTSNGTNVVRDNIYVAPGSAWPAGMLSITNNAGVH